VESAACAISPGRAAPGRSKANWNLIASAFVGLSGAGKSTIISLIARFYDPVSGHVKIDVRNYTLQSLRGQMSFVLQDTVLFQAPYLAEYRLRKTRKRGARK
jgi:ABC-type transport system involved in Fe-S cluster assembly fused permease/ATPase subunit